MSFNAVTGASFSWSPSIINNSGSNYVSSQAYLAKQMICMLTWCFYCRTHYLLVLPLLLSGHTNTCSVAASQSIKYHMLPQDLSQHKHASWLYQWHSVTKYLGLFLPCADTLKLTPIYTTHRLACRGSRLPSSIQPGPPCAWLRTRHTCFHSAAAPLKSTCGGLFLQRLGLLCPNFPLYTQIICAWVMQTEGSSKCMWTPLMAPANWSWNRVVGSWDGCS